MAEYRYITQTSTSGEIHVFYETPYKLINNTIKNRIIEAVIRETMLPESFYENENFIRVFKDDIRDAVLFELVGEMPDVINSNVIPKIITSNDKK